MIDPFVPMLPTLGVLVLLLELPMLPQSEDRVHPRRWMTVLALIIDFIVTVLSTLPMLVCVLMLKRLLLFIDLARPREAVTRLVEAIDTIDQLLLLLGVLLRCLSLLLLHRWGDITVCQQLLGWLRSPLLLLLAYTPDLWMRMRGLMTLPLIHRRKEGCSSLAIPRLKSL